MKLITIRPTGEGWDHTWRLVRIWPQRSPACPGNPDILLAFIDGCILRSAPTSTAGATLALFGELANNILAKKNEAAWAIALKAGGNRDYTLRILPEGESHAARGEDRQQRGNGVTAAVRAGILHDHPGLALETDPGVQTRMRVPEAISPVEACSAIA